MKLRETDKQDIISLYDLSWPVSWIAHAYEVSAKTVYIVTAACGRRHRSVTDEELQFARAHPQYGPTSIARALDISLGHAEYIKRQVRRGK